MYLKMNLTDQSKENLWNQEKPDKQSLSRLALRSLSVDGKDSKNPGSSKNEGFEYSKEITTFLLSEQSNFSIPPKYLSSQKDITSKMRAILIDWLVSVHKRFKLLPETLFLSVKIIDRYLLYEQTNRKDLQLIGVAALFLASKYEEIYPPELRDLILLTDNAYNKEQALTTERKILKTLDFSITMPSS
jgi:Cyclin